MSTGSTRPEVVFISSLGHSGSTALERALSTCEDVVGIGEVYQLLTTLEDRTDVERHPCGCGVAVHRCALWGPIVATLSTTSRDPVERYRVVLDATTELLGPTRVLVDNSKSSAALQSLLATGVRVAAVDLTRDVRSWVVAMQARAHRRAQDPQHRASDVRTRIAQRRAATPWALFTTWDHMNLDRKQQLRATGIPFVEMGYEPFAANPATELGRLTVALGLAPADSAATLDGDLRSTTVHTIFANNMKLSPDLRDHIIMDTRWMTATSWQLPATVRRAVMRRNRQWVHAAGDHDHFSR